MQVFHTAGAPPSSGSTIFATIGCTTNRRLALTKAVKANNTVRRLTREIYAERGKSCDSRSRGAEFGRSELERPLVGRILRCRSRLILGHAAMEGCADLFRRRV